MYRITIRPLSFFSSLPDSIKIANALIFSADFLGEDKKEKLIGAFQRGDVRVSSMLPVRDGELYVPFPLSLKERILSEPSLNKMGGSLIKKIKSCPYIPLSLISSDLKSILSFVTASGHLSFEVDVPHNTGRFSSSPTYFQESLLLFACDLSFFVESPEDLFNEVIAPSLKLLSDMGLSKKASSGRGHFSITSVQEDSFAPGKQFLLVSKLYPPGDFSSLIVHHFTEFKALTREGMHVGPLLLLAEGSVLSKTEEGKFIPEYGGIRYSMNLLGFYIPINLPSQEAV